jgi:hypothetical protein
LRLFSLRRWWSRGCRYGRAGVPSSIRRRIHFGIFGGSLLRKRNRRTCSRCEREGLGDVSARLSVRGTVSFARPLDVALERCGKPGGCEEEEEKGGRQLHTWPIRHDAERVFTEVFRMMMGESVSKSAQGAGLIYSFVKTCISIAIFQSKTTSERSSRGLLLLFSAHGACQHLRIPILRGTTVLVRLSTAHKRCEYLQPPQFTLCGSDGGLRYALKIKMRRASRAGRTITTCK